MPARKASQTTQQSTDRRSGMIPELSQHPEKIAPTKKQNPAKTAGLQKSLWDRCRDRPKDLLRLRCAGHFFSLRALLSLRNIELYIVAFLQAAIAVRFDRAVVHKNIRTIITS